MTVLLTAQGGLVVAWGAETAPASGPASAPATASAPVIGSAVSAGVIGAGDGPDRLAVAATMAAPAPATGPTTAVASTAAATAPVAEARLERGGGGKALPTGYDVLERKSIFSKERIRRTESARRFGYGGSVARAPAPPVFIGAVLEDSGFVGFIENPDTGQWQQVHRGDKLPNGGGTVTEVSLDYLDIVADGEAAGTPAKRIVVGQNLLGAAAGPRDGVTTAPSGVEGAATAPATTGPDDLMERLRRRRLQELGK